MDTVGAAQSMASHQVFGNRENVVVQMQLNERIEIASDDLKNCFSVAVARAI